MRLLVHIFVGLVVRAANAYDDWRHPAPKPGDALASDDIVEWP